MKKKPYLPRREGDRVTWLNTFAAKLAVHAATFGITPLEVAMVAAFALMYAYIIGLQELVKTFKQDLTDYKKTLSRASIGSPLGAPPTLTIPVAPATVQAGIFTVIAGLVKRIKGKTDVYTVNICEDLGIIGDEDDFVPDTFVPEFKGKIMPEGPKLEFGKDQTDGVHIYTSLKGVAEWNYLATDTESPYIDTRAL
ncbi:MAG TPA: hypothetical protein VI757_01770, partial [Bacteroidia bacterium]|nr:hypothetical protein [Bacteroidia bacterium]